MRCNKITMKTIQNQNNIHTSQFSAPETINIYFRNAKKEARLVPVHTPLYTKELIVLASMAFNIPQERIILFYNGFRIDNYYLPVTLTQRSIIHVIDRRNFEFQQIILNFKPLWNAPLQKLACSPENLVREVVDSFLVPQLQMPQNKFFLVYAGKILNRSNKLNEQFIEDGSEITLVLFRTQKEVFDKVAYEHNTQKKSEFNQFNSNTNCPVTYLTTLEALKKKTQQQNALQLNQILINQNPAAPKPPSNLMPFNFNQSNISNPLGLSLINLSKIQEKQSKVSEKVAPGGSMSPAPSSSSQRVAPPIKVQVATAPKNKSIQGESSNNNEASVPKEAKEAQNEEKKSKLKVQPEQKPKIDQKILLLESFYGVDQKNKEKGIQKPLSHIASENSAAPE